MQQRHSQTSGGIPIKNRIFDRESGKPIIIQSPCFDLMMSDSSLSLRTDWRRLPQDKLIVLLKCLLILQTMPEAGLQEAADELEAISRFYSNRLSQTNLPMIPASSIKGKLRATQVRPPIVLEP